MTRVNARGQVTIPAQIRRQLGFGAGDEWSSTFRATPYTFGSIGRSPA
jgi:bifunctional DNA-binding transcriptional regulator/antitoxin component of YhaV-PrlF toxin-antitoxin module